MGSRMTGMLLWATLVSSLGGLLFGFDTVVISGAQEQLKALFELTSFEQGFLTASALIGTVIGALGAAQPGDRYGRRDALKVAGVLYLVSAVGCAFAWDFWSLVVFRVIGGFGVGASSVLGPMYLAEIAPAEWRGRLVAFFQFNVVLGVLLAFLSNLAFGQLALGEAEWRWKLGIEALPAFLFWACLYTIPRSPRWLVLQNHHEEASRVLTQLGVRDVTGQLAQIRQSLRQEDRARREPLWQKKFAQPIFLAITVAMFNQLGGINALMYYMNPIFSMAGYNKVSGDIQSVWVGVANLLATMAGMLLIDHAGRKTLLIVGTVLTGSTLAGIAWIFSGQEHHGWLLWLLVGYIIGHAFGQGAVIWVYISEVFPTAVRAKGQTLGSATHWFMAMLVSWSFPIFAKDAGEPGAGLPFAFFAVMMVVQIVVVALFFPETKRVSLESLSRRQHGKSGPGPEWRKVSARIVRGHQVASGGNQNPHFPGGTLSMQTPFFREHGLDLDLFHRGTLNVSLTSGKPVVRAAKHTFPRVKWHPVDPAEDFSFFDVYLETSTGDLVPGLVYYPHPETKPTHFQAESVLELLLPYVPGLSYEQEISLWLHREQLDVVPA